jgi:Zn-dependent peptidase ImmA (M78 family)/O-acetyl-ADP-ribose deacetylase (regulator of RNase III)
MERAPLRRWTNKSVLLLAGTADPIVAMEERARDTVLRAVDRGWSGPPFDPIKLADILGIAVRPRADIVDARTVPVGPTGLAIEFNPGQPRERVRFSIAHEIAHSFFTDCAAEVRNRGEHANARTDEWQLEVLCNIAASELVMPIGSFGEIKDEPLSIERLMRLRLKFDVSAEAILIRAVKVTNEPALMFCASARDQHERPSYATDYFIPSRAWTRDVPAVRTIGSDTVLAECTAIGYTAHRFEEWPTMKGRLEVQCMGLAPYPGSRLPRVAGFVRICDGGTSGSGIRVQYVDGDALEPRGLGVRMVCHIVPDRSYIWGGNGFAANVRRRFPNVQQEFKDWAQGGGRKLRLGNIHFAIAEDSVWIASMIAQHGFGPSAAPRLRYEALEQCLEQAATKARAEGASIHMPRIGTGSAGGSWEMIEELIVDKLLRSGVTVTVYDLPPRSSQPSQSDLFSRVGRTE